MELTSWEFWTLITRWWIYLGMAASIGGACSLHLTKTYVQLNAPLLRYALISSFIGIVAAVSYFFVRVGSAMEEGAAGMFEPDMVSIMWESALGDALLLRALGFLLFFIAVLLFLIKKESLKQEVTLGLIETLSALIGIGLIAFSFTKAGHAVDQPILFHWVLAIHVLLTAWWIGSLYPLWLTCHRLSFDDAHIVLERFGQLAVVAVLILFCGGLYLSYQLTGWSALLSDNYGTLLLIKLGLVGTILLLAAIHKLYLVPQLLHSKDASTLKKSIMMEKVIGAGILGITTLMTTLVGPSH